MKPIPNHPGYFVDKHGNVYSIKPAGRYAQPPTEPRLLKPHRMKRKGETGRSLAYLFEDGRLRTFKVAALVLEAFVSPRPKGTFACHGVRGCTDDSLDNVYWGTPSRNTLDRYRDGTMSYGEKNGNRKLNELQVRIIIRFSQTTGSKSGAQTYLASVFGVNQTNISQIVLNKTWRHLSRHLN